MAKVLASFRHAHVEEYAQVTKMLGNGRVEALCIDGIARLCHIRGKLRKKVRKYS
jgi:initiation factor 1A